MEQAFARSCRLVGRRAGVIATGIAGVLLMLAWIGPALWFPSGNRPATVRWMQEQTDLARWQYRTVPVERAAEGLLVAEHLANGEFLAANGEVVRVFCATRLTSLPNENEIFAHPPDRCWVRVGWSLKPVTPETVTVVWPDHLRMTLERRIFRHGAAVELVYFGGLIDGEAVPYRLDQFLPRPDRGRLGIGSLHEIFAHGVRSWNFERARRGFAQHAAATVSKQFIRLSTPVEQGDIGAADALLSNFVVSWLQPAEGDLATARRRMTPPAGER